MAQGSDLVCTAGRRGGLLMRAVGTVAASTSHSVHTAIWITQGGYRVRRSPGKTIACSSRQGWVVYLTCGDRQYHFSLKGNGPSSPDGDTERGGGGREEGECGRAYPER
jgi:hypothetical protein